MRLFSFLVFAVLICCFSGCGKGRRNEAVGPTTEDIAQFEVLMGRLHDPDVNTAYVSQQARKCFKEGEAASRYERIFSRAKKENCPPGSEHEYSYTLFSGEFFGLRIKVFVGGDPPVITGYEDYSVDIDPVKPAQTS